MCSTGRLTVKCLEIRELWYVAYTLAFALVLQLTICRITRSLSRGTQGPHKIRSQIRQLTCGAWHVYIWRVLGANAGTFLGMDLWSISPLNIKFRFDTCMEHLNTCDICIFEYIIESWALWCDLPNFAML